MGLDAKKMRGDIDTRLPYVVPILALSSVHYNVCVLRGEGGIIIVNGALLSIHFAVSITPVMTLKLLQLFSSMTTAVL